MQMESYLGTNQLFRTAELDCLVTWNRQIFKISLGHLVQPSTHHH